MPSTKVELLPCPFCGSEPWVEPENPAIQGDAWTRISCNYCEVSPSVKVCADGTHFAEAAAAWNTRTPSHGGEKSREALARAIDPEAFEATDNYDQRASRNMRRAEAYSAADRVSALASPTPVDRAEAAYACASDAACTCYPGVDQAALRDAFCSGAAYQADGTLPPAAQPLEGLTSGEGDVFVVALALSKANGPTTTYSMSMTWRTGGTEQEAVDAAILYAAKEKPGFGVWEKLVARIPAASPSNHAGSVGEAAIQEAAHVLARVSVSDMVGKCGWRSYEDAQAGLARVIAALHPIDSCAAQEKGV